MTEFELASLHAQIGDNLAAALTNYLTIVSLYLGAGFLVAHRLALPSAVTFTSIFLVVNAEIVFAMFNAFRTSMGVAGQIRALAEQGKGLAWHHAATIPAWAQTYVPVFSAILLTAVVVGAVYFFFASRRHNLKTQPLAQ